MEINSLNMEFRKRTKIWAGYSSAVKCLLSMHKAPVPSLAPHPKQNKKKSETLLKEDGNRSKEKKGSSFHEFLYSYLIFDESTNANQPIWSASYIIVKRIPTLKTLSQWRTCVQAGLHWCRWTEKHLQKAERRCRLLLWAISRGCRAGRGFHFSKVCEL